MSREHYGPSSIRTQQSNRVMALRMEIEKLEKARKRAESEVTDWARYADEHPHDNYYAGQLAEATASAESVRARLNKALEELAEALEELEASDGVMP